MKKPVWVPKQPVSDDKVLLEPGKYPSLNAELEAKGIKLKYSSSPAARGVSTQNAIVQDLVKSQGSFLDLLNKNDPTQIPYLTTSIGNMLVNPSTVSLSTLMKVAQNEIVAKCLSMDAASVMNTVGEIKHEDKQIEKMLQKNIHETEGGLRDIVEKIGTADIFGFSLNYIRDYIDNNGATRLRQLDLLPPSGILFSSTPEGNIQNIYQYIYTYPYANTQNLFSFPFSAEGAIFQNETQGIDPLASYSNIDFVLRTNILNTFGLIALNKDLCIHTVCDNMLKIQNPYGYNPLTRRVYDLTLLYDLYKQLHSTFLSYRACPLLVGYADSSKTVDLDLKNGETLNALESLYNSFATMGTNGALILSGLKDQIYHIEAINTQGDTKAFENALTLLTNQIQECMGLFNLNEGGSFATATAQTSVYGRLILDKKDKRTDVIKKRLFKYLIHKNFSPKITNYGYFENEVPNLDDRLKAVKIMEATAATKGFAPGVIKKDNDYQRMQTGEPLLSNEEFEEMKKAQIEADNPMDNSSRVNGNESLNHYQHAGKTAPTGGKNG